MSKLVISNKLNVHKRVQFPLSEWSISVTKVAFDKNTLFIYVALCHYSIC